MSNLPVSVKGIDRELEQCRQVLDAMQVRSSRQIVMEQIDALLDQRTKIVKRRRRVVVSTDRR